MKKLVFLLIIAIIPFANVITAEQSVIILLGPPGSGKGTQAVNISKEKNIPHISTGDLFRENIKRGTDLGKTAQQYMHQGQLVPDSLVIEMLLARISQKDCLSGYLLDGFPRNIDQALAFDKHFSKENSLTVLYLDVSDQSVIKRISGRESCVDCGAIYNRFFQPVKHAGICDQCGGVLIQRKDDLPEVVKNRLETYRKQTAPLIDYYKNKGVLRRVNGEGDPEPVSAKVRSILLD